MFRFFHTMMILTMLLIFCFSSQNGEESSEISNAALLWILNIIGSLTSAEFQLWLTIWIRKAAHFSIYLCLGFFSAGMMENRSPEKEKQILWSLWGWLIAVSYAVTDEFHQLFVPGRAGRLFDIGIDGAGAAAGVLLFTAIYTILNILKRKSPGD